ncbi:MAG: MFS transporter [Candidatus Limnocylindrales bacterium]
MASLARPHPVPTVTDGLWSAPRRALTVGLVLSITLVAFEALAVSTVMPVVARELGGLDLYGWVFSAFFLANLIGIVVVGILIDRGGLIRPFVGGLSLFGIGLLIGGLAPTMPILIAGRFLQGFGAGAIAPVAYVAIGRSLPEELRARMFATLSTAWVLPGVIGPAIAGLIAEQWTWRAVFLGLIPLIVVSGSLAVVGLRRVPAVDPAHASAEHAVAADSGRRLPRAILLSFSAALVLAGLSNPEPILAVAFVAVGRGLGVPAFRSLEPAGALQAGGRLPSAVLLRGLATFSFFSVDAYVSLLLVDWRGTTPAVAGIALTGATVSWTAGSWIQARGVARYGPARFVGVGMAVVAAGIGATALVLLPSVPIAWAVPAFSLAGFGMGLAYSSFTLVVLSEAEPGAEGTATAGLQLSDTLGTALGTGIAGAFVAVSVRAGQVSAVGIALSFAMGAAVAILASALSPHLRRAVAPARMSVSDEAAADLIA